MAQELKTDELGINSVKKIIRRAIDVKISSFIHGTMGIGKSDGVLQIAESIAKEKGKTLATQLVEVFVEGDKVKEVRVEKKYLDPEKHFFLMDVRITSLDPSDLRGLPFPDGNAVKWLSPDWLPKMGEGILFFDEMNLAPPSMQASAYQLILNRRVGDYFLPDGWSIVSAGNRAIDKANVFTMAAPLKNRFIHVTMRPPSEEEWREWAIDNNINSDIIAFMAFSPTKLFMFDKNSKSNSFPTPRSWAMASKMIDGIKDETDIYEFTSSAVGEGVANAFVSFVKMKKKVNVSDILKNPKKVRSIDDRGVLFSLVSGLSEKYKADRKLMDPILNVVNELQEEFGVFTLRLMKGMNKSNFIKDLTGSKNWKSLANKYQKFLC